MRGITFPDKLGKAAAALKRLSLGFVLITASSGLLLLSDWNQRRAGTGSLPRVALVQHATQAILDEGIQGMVDGLAENGFVEGKTVLIQRYNAESDIATANAIAKEVTDGRFDLILTATTMSLQTVANANQEGKSRHVFGFVSDPFSAGVGINRENPLDHPRHLTGIGSMPLVAETFRAALQMFPALKRVGAPWNPAESNSVANMRLARKVAKELGIELLEANVENSAAVQEAANSLIARGVQAVWAGGDLTIIVALDSVIAAAKQAWIPVFTSIPGNVERGALFDVGGDVREIGKRVGALAAQVLRGVSPASIPVRNFVTERLVINPKALEALKDPWRFPKDVLAGATIGGKDNPR